MPKYGVIMNGELLISNTMLLNYKPIEYASVPEDFDEVTQYITQSEAEDMGDYIYIGINIHNLEVNDDEYNELIVEP